MHHKIDATAFETALARKGISRSRLAEELGISRNTIRHMEDGKPSRDGTVAKVAAYLGVNVEELTGAKPAMSESELREFARSAGLHLQTVRLNTVTNLNYQLVADRYGATPASIVDAAPLCFALLAEMSLAARRSDLARLRDAADQLSGHAHVPAFNSAFGRADHAINLEDSSIRARDLHGELTDPEGERDGAGPFFAMLDALALEHGLYVADREFAAPLRSFSDTWLLEPEFRKVTGEDRDAEFALEKRYTTIQSIPKHLRPRQDETDVETEARISWLRAQVPQAVKEEREAERAKWADVSIEELFSDNSKGD